jgi:NAD(P)-dependent dehydrogenase (short-subunit alcohol dehydrogenase family)
MSKTELRTPRAGADARWRLDGKVALVTGASADLGARFARVLHAAGAHVIVTARRADRLTELAHECPTRMETLPGDITDPAHRQHLADLARRHGRLDVLVNNAGICDDGPLEQQSLADLRQVAEVNLTRHLAAVWGQDGVRVNALAPGYFPTELAGFLTDPAFAQFIRDRTPLGRTPAPDELDAPLLFLATAASSYMTGQALVIDGGWTAA